MKDYAHTMKGSYKKAGKDHSISVPGVSGPRGVPTVNFSKAGANVKSRSIDKADKKRRKY